MIGFIGGGNMAEAMIKGMRQSGMKDIMVSEPVQERRFYLEHEYAVKTTPDNKEVVRNCSICVLAVKPQHMDNVTGEIADSLSDDKIIISIASQMIPDQALQTIRNCRIQGENILARLLEIAKKS